MQTGKWLCTGIMACCFSLIIQAQDREVRTFNIELGMSETWQNTGAHDVNVFMNDFNNYHQSALKQKFDPINNVHGKGYYFNMVLRGEGGLMYTTGVSYFRLKSRPSTALFYTNYGREMRLYYDLVDFNFDIGGLIRERVYLGFIWGASFITAGVTGKFVFPDGSATSAKASPNYGVFMTETGLFSFWDNTGFSVGFQYKHAALNFRWSAPGLLVKASNALTDPAGGNETAFVRNYMQTANYTATDYCKGSRISLQLVYRIPCTYD